MVEDIEVDILNLYVCIYQANRAKDKMMKIVAENARIFELK